MTVEAKPTLREKTNDRKRSLSFPNRWQVACLLILILSAIAYLPAMSGLFFWDDIALVDGGGIGGGDSLVHCFTRPFLHHYYRPMVSISFYLENQISGNIPFFYH